MKYVNEGMDDLFPPHTRARDTDPGTSHEAARKVSPKISAARRKVLLLFADHHRLTDLRLETLCADHGSTFRTRRAELVEMGYVSDSGERVEQNGTMRTIWTITVEGLAVARIMRGEAP